MHEGHRKRIIDRLANNQESLQEHELLEILLFNAIPRKNTNEIAHRLLSAFGGIDGVFRASMQELQTVGGIGQSTAAYLKCIALFYEKLSLPDKDALPRALSLGDVSGFVTQRLQSLEFEAIEVYALDESKRVRDVRRFTVGSANMASISPEALNAFIAAKHPAAIIVAHNHVRTTCKPSAEDDIFTAQAQMVCSMNNIDLYDHLILGTDGLYSYFGVGKLQAIREQFSINKFLGKTFVWNGEK